MADEDLKALKMTFLSSSEGGDIDFKVKTFLNDSKNWSKFRYKIKLRLNKVNKTRNAVIVQDDRPTTTVPLQNAIKKGLITFHFSKNMSSLSKWVSE